MNTLVNMFSNQYLLLLIAAAIGAAIGNIKIKGFSLGSAAGIFSGIFVGWAMTAIVNKNPGLWSSLATVSENGSVSVTLVSDAFSTFFLLLFICSIGLSVGSKIKTVLNLQGLKLIVIGVLIPVVAMAMTWGCLKAAPALMGDDYNGYQISGMYSGAMTNTAAYGNSMAVVSGMDDVADRYAALSDEDKTLALEMIGAEDTTPTDALAEGQIGAFKGKAKANISLGYAISFPVGTLVIIIAMSIFAALTKKQRASEALETSEAVAAKKAVAGQEKPLFFDAVVYGIVFFFGIALGSIKIPLGNVNFTLSPVGGVLISSLVFSNIPKIGPIDMRSNPKVLAFMREFSQILFMSVIGMQYGYDVVHAFTGSGLVIALMAAVVEIVAILAAVVIGRLMKIRWDRLSGAICGGCTSATGLGAAVSTMGHEEPVLGYGVAQPFAILANVLLISWYHGTFFI